MLDVDVVLFYAHSPNMIVSPDRYRQVREALAHYLKTGEIIVTKYGLDKPTGQQAESED